jgi:hypothetical protein
MTISITNVAIGCLAIVVGSGTVLYIGHLTSQNSPIPQTPAVIVHTTDWYMAHPDIAKADEERCGNNAGSISVESCQNDAAAEEKMLSNDLLNAAKANSASASGEKPNTQ